MKSRFCLKSSVFILLSLVLPVSSCEPVKEKMDELEYDLEEIFELDTEFQETSGIVIYDSLIWNINDGGNKAVLYGISLKNGDIVTEVNIEGASNTDWEDIAQDQQNIYIGDFGNNFGDRKDLKIYIIPKSQLTTASEQTIQPEIITFNYEDQEDFERSQYATSFDCEAMIVRNGVVWLFTKDWNTEKSTLYTFSANAGERVAKRITTIDSEGLVTGADFEESTGDLYLCGYNQFMPFVLFLTIDGSGNISETFTRADFPDYFSNQIEAIAAYNNRIYLTNESYAYVQTLWELISN